METETNALFKDQSHWIFSEGSEYKNQSFINSWITPELKTGKHAEIVINLGCEKTVNGFYIRNTHFGRHLGRGTKQFTIFTKDVLHETWKPILTSEFKKFAEGNVEQTLFFPLNSILNLQYVQVHVDKFYAKGGGLHYFSKNESEKEGESYTQADQ